MTDWGPSAGWGDPGAESSEEVPHGNIPLGNGHSMQLNPEAFRGLLHHPSVIKALEERSRHIAEAANQLAASRPDGRSAEYTYKIQNASQTSRARGLVKPGNYIAVVDNAAHSTLHKAMDMYPSDPKPDVDEAPTFAPSAQAEAQELPEA